jgi:hypothetical protein
MDPVGTPLASALASIVALRDPSWRMRSRAASSMVSVGCIWGRGMIDGDKRVTAAVRAAEGSENTMVEAHRVWVQLRQIADGHWAAFGEGFTLADAAAYGLKDEPDSKTGRMRQAAMESVGAVSTA